MVEFIELPEHKFFVATQAHPEFKSRPMKPSPLFDGFIKAINRKDLPKKIEASVQLNE